MTETPDILMAGNSSMNFKTTMECDEKNISDQSKASKTEEDLLADDSVAEKAATSSDVICSLAEGDEQTSGDEGLVRETGGGVVVNQKEKDPLSLSMYEEAHDVSSTRSEYYDDLSETDDDMNR